MREKGAGQVPQGDALQAVGRVVLLTVLLIVALEFALQVKSHLFRGQSVFNLLSNQTRYVMNPDSGLKTLRPGSRLGGATITIETNRFGLRSPEIPLEREPRSFRMAVVGASSVMGEMAVSNDATFSYLLERKLRAGFPDARVDVINAGISGHRLADQRRMIESVVLAHDPDVVVVYSGFNDFADYCAPRPSEGARKGLPLLKMPDWILSIEAIKRHTRPMRPAAQRATVIPPEQVDVERYRRELGQIAELAQANGVSLVLVTNAKAYGRTLPLPEQQRLAADPMRFAPCFDLDGMLALYERHNELIRQAGDEYGIPVFDLGAVLPEGLRYFVDATHFSAEGEETVAQYLHDFLIAEDLVSFRE
jgi:lysophospholipase L1-like esterase